VISEPWEDFAEGPASSVACGPLLSIDAIRGSAQQVARAAVQGGKGFPGSWGRGPVHSAVGFAVTQKWIGRRRICERITKDETEDGNVIGWPNKGKSAQRTKSCIWFSERVRPRL